MEGGQLETRGHAVLARRSRRGRAARACRRGSMPLHASASISGRQPPVDVRQNGRRARA